MMRVPAVSAAVLAAGLAVLGAAVDVAAQEAAAPPPAALDHDALNGVVGTYCQRCHNDRMLTGNFSLDGFDVGAAGGDAERAEKMIRKLRANMMPPPGMRRPPAETLAALVETLESVVDETAAADPNPGYRTFQRLNRHEYAQAVRDLLALDIDAGDYLPLDTMSANFDNIADVQLLSATLLDGYLRAAAEVSQLAVGNPNALPKQTTYAKSRAYSQWDQVEGPPTAPAAGSRWCTTSRPTGTTSSGWRSSTRPPAACRGRRSGTSRSRSPSTASRRRCWPWTSGCGPPTPTG